MIGRLNGKERGPNRDRACQCRARSLFIYKWIDIGQTEEIGKEQDEKDKDQGADQTADTEISSSRQGIDALGQFHYFLISATALPER